MLDTSVSAVETLLVRGKQNLRARTRREQSRGLDGMNDDRLDEHCSTTRSPRDAVNAHDRAAAMRVLARLAPPCRRRSVPFWRLPGVLLDWQFAPAWPRMAALAGCAVLGFSIGIAGVDARIDHASAQPTRSSRRRLSAVVFEPESLTGDGHERCPTRVHVGDRAAVALAAARLAGAQPVLRRHRSRHGDARAGASPA